MAIMFFNSRKQTSSKNSSIRRPRLDAFPKDTTPTTYSPTTSSFVQPSLVQSSSHSSNQLANMGFSSFFTVVLSLALTLRVQAVGIGSAAPYAVLGASTVTNTGLTKLNGELGVYPGTAITGFPPGVLTGGTHSADATSKQAQLDAHAAYDTAAGLPYAPADDLTGQDLGGKTLVPSVYHFSSSVGVTGTLTLDAKGDSNAVWVFQIGSTITTASASAVKLINGAQACNVIWQVGSSATLGTGTNFAGNVVALASITATTGVTNAGGLYALTAAVTLDTNQISGQPNCANKPIALPATSSTITIPFVPITSSITAIIPSSSAAPVVTS